MSDGNQNRGNIPLTNPASQTIRQLDGATIQGGCDHCNAYQTVHADFWGPNMHRIAIHHDDWCPVLQQTGSQP